MGIGSLPVHQGRMVSLLSNLPVSNHQDLIRVPDRLQPVGNHQQGLVPAQLGDGFLDRKP